MAVGLLVIELEKARNLPQFNGCFSNLLQTNGDIAKSQNSQVRG